MTNTGKINTAQWLSIISCGLPRALFARQTVGCLLWAAILLIQPFPSEQTAHATTPSTSPEFARYPDMTVGLSGDSTVTPDVPPSGATAINASISTNFQGMLTADLTTGVVRVTNAHPAGTYTVTVHADIRGAPSISAFQLIVQQGKSCAAGPGFTPTADGPGSNTPISVAVGDFNNDGKQDLAIGSDLSHSVSIQLGDGLGGTKRAI